MRSPIVAPELVVVGTSKGGFNALQVLLAGIPADFCVPIVVVQHRHKTSNEMLGRILEKSAKIPVRDVEDKLPIERGCIHLAPADYHLLIESEGVFSLSTEGPVRYSRPSVDVLFQTAADVYGNRLIGIVMTGANDDGAAGVQAIKQNGGTVIVQDPATAEAPDMPRAAIAAAHVDHILRLEEISRYLVQACAPAVNR